MDIHVYHHFVSSPGSQSALALITAQLKELVKQGESNMATLQQVLDDVQAEPSLIASLSALITGLQKQVNDVLTGVTLPAGVQAQVDMLFAAAEANKKAFADALVAVPAPVPAVPAPVPAPPIG